LGDLGACGRQGQGAELVSRHLDPREQVTFDLSHKQFFRHEFLEAMQSSRAV
jgi:hypothetical protein